MSGSKQPALSTSKTITTLAVPWMRRIIAPKTRITTCLPRTSPSPSMLATILGDQSIHYELRARSGRSGSLRCIAHRVARNEIDLGASPSGQRLDRTQCEQRLRVEASRLSGVAQDLLGECLLSLVQREHALLYARSVDQAINGDRASSNVSNGAKMLESCGFGRLPLAPADMDACQACTARSRATSGSLR